MRTRRVEMEWMSEEESEGGVNSTLDFHCNSLNSRLGH